MLLFLASVYYLHGRGIFVCCTCTRLCLCVHACMHVCETYKQKQLGRWTIFPISLWDIISVHPWQSMPVFLRYLKIWRKLSAITKALTAHEKWPDELRSLKVCEFWEFCWEMGQSTCGLSWARVYHFGLRWAGLNQVSSSSSARDSAAHSQPAKDYRLAS